MNGPSQKVTGKAKQGIGKATGNEKLQAEGKADELIGTLKSKLDKATDTIEKKVDTLKSNLENNK